MRPELCLLLLAGLASPAVADPVPADCAVLVAGLEALDGYKFSAPPAADAQDWCVFDGAALTAARSDRPNLSAERLRLRGTVDGTALVALDVDMAGLRVMPKAGDRTMDDRLRAMFRLQTADLRLAVGADPGGDWLQLRNVQLRLSGGSELDLAADISGTGLTSGALALGSLTMLEITWRNDGRVLRPAMEAAGERLVEGATGGEAVDATRRALGDLAAALPDAALEGESRGELAELLAALPQGRGRLRLVLTSEDGIGAGRLAVAALADDPTGPAALGRVLAGSILSVDWQPGLSP